MLHIIIVSRIVIKTAKKAKKKTLKFRKLYAIYYVRHNYYA